MDVSFQENGLAPTIHQLDQQVNNYEDPELLELARKEIPLEKLQTAAKELQKSARPLPGYEDALAEKLVKWFKDNYLRWADAESLRCTSCKEKTESIGYVEPTQDDINGGAQQVEGYQCKACSTVVRFPRYNNLRYLMGPHIRIGRCGEFANLFALFIRAVGLRGRYVWNAEDHVWNEYYSPTLNRWVHMDSCEKARDKALLYDVGWKKKQSYILAFSTEGAQDVSIGYIKDFEDALSRRTRMPEDQLQQCLADVTKRRRAGLSSEKLQQLEHEDQGEMKFLQRVKTDKELEEPLPPRQSGDPEWRAERKEDGSGTA